MKSERHGDVKGKTTQNPRFYAGFLYNVHWNPQFYGLSTNPTPRRHSNAHSAILSATLFFRTRNTMRALADGIIAMRTAAKSLSGAPPAVVSPTTAEAPGRLRIWFRNTTQAPDFTKVRRNFRSPDASTRLCKPGASFPMPASSSRRGTSAAAESTTTRSTAPEPAN